MSNDVEKRWHDPGALRAAVLYVVAVIVVAGAAFTGYALGNRHDLGWAFATPGVLFIGALAAFVKTYRDWRARRTWPIWQGAGWFLLTTTLLSFGIPSMGVLGGAMNHLGLRNRTPSVERTMAAPPEAAWDVLTDLDAWPKWGPTVRRAELSDPGPLRLGSRGRVWTPVGIPLPFEITEFDAGCGWAWKVAGVSATRHTVEKCHGGCRVVFGVPIWAPVYLTVCALALNRLEGLIADIASRTPGDDGTDVE